MRDHSHNVGKMFLNLLLQCHGDSSNRDGIKRENQNLDLDIQAIYGESWGGVDPKILDPYIDGGWVGQGHKNH